MLYEDIQQLEVRYVISLDSHDVDLYNGGDHIPEGELWIKRNAIRLTRRDPGAGEKSTSLPYFMFGENLSDKEDFYFALLKNQQKRLDRETPEVQQFDVKDMVTLVQKLHSSEEHLQTRWLNAMMGRWFLAMYKTPQLEDLIRNKLTKKITRVKKPNFITKLALQKIDLGDGAPFITNPRLKDLTVGGDCTVEADVKYTGNFRIEVAATARIDLGTRFKARDIDLVLAVTVNKLEGHALVRFKPPPSNRIWFTFEKMPTLEMTVKPIVSTRQITLTVVLKAIESRIREVLAESIVLPFWDDVPFADSTEESCRGGIWKKATAPSKSTEIHDEDPEDEAETGPSSGTQTPAEITKISDERVFSTPVLSTTRDSMKPRPGKHSVASMSESSGDGVSTSVERSSQVDGPRSLRSSSFATTAAALVTASHADAKRDSNGTMQNSDVAAMLKDLTSRSITASPAESPIGSLQNEPTLASAMGHRSSSNVSLTSTESPSTPLGNHSKQPSTSSSILRPPSQGSIPATPTSDSFESERDLQAAGPKRAHTFASTARSLTGGDRKQAIAQISAAAGAAQQWGWGVLNKRRQQKEGASNGSPELRPDVPMGRGHPLPPPGMPLPPPARSSTKVSLGGLVPKRKPLPPPLLPKRNQVDGPAETEASEPSPRPPLPERRQRKSLQNGGDAPVEEVVQAPVESAPNSPSEEHHDDFFGHGEDSAVPPLTKLSHQVDDDDMYEAQAVRRESEGIGPDAWLKAVEGGD